MEYCSACVRNATSTWELGVGKAHAWGRPQCMHACKSTMIRAVGLGREPTGVILMAGGWAQGASFPAGVPRLLTCCSPLIEQAHVCMIAPCIEPGTRKKMMA